MLNKLSFATMYLGIRMAGGVTKGGAVRPRRQLYGGGTMGYAVGCKPVHAVLK